jgi:DinB superfamily
MSPEASMGALTPEERSAAVAEIEASRQRLLAALEGLTEEEWRRRPSPDRWSIAECAEHITAAELPLAKFLAVSATTEPSEEERREIRGKDDFVRQFLRDRSRRDEAPERIRPKGRFATREDTIRAFEERRAANLACVRETSEPLRDRFAPHPFAGVIDGYQWVLFLAAHTDRHAEQIEEIRQGLRSKV